MAATVSTAAAAAEAMGIPDQTLRYWLDDPEFADLRKKTRDELAAGSMVLAQLAGQELARKIKAGEVEGRDLATIYGIAIDKGQLLAGQATARTETRDITAELTETQKEELAASIDDFLKSTATVSAE